MSGYNRQAAVEYAHTWAYGRNPRFFDFEKLGGDCTNFASQCLLAGGGVMNYKPTFGWYYSSANQKAPAWTGVEYLYRFLTRRENSVGPRARECDIRSLQPGDIVQLSFSGSRFQHSPVVVEVSEPFAAGDILLAAHSFDTDRRPLSTYAYKKIRFLHIEDVP